MTSFSLRVRNVKNRDQFSALFESIEELDLNRYVFDTGAYYNDQKEAIFKCWEAQEWKSYNEQMIILSEKYPKLTFELTCQNEDAFWRIYYKDGINEQCNGEVLFERPIKIEWEALSAF